MKKLRITVEGKVYEVLVELLDEAGSPAGATPAPATSPAPLAPPRAQASAPAPPLAPASPAPAASASSAADGDIPSPLAGKVVSIDVKVGQTVAEGAQVATVEAMKMNTYIYAPRAGTVSAILTTPGDGVEEGAPLLRLG